MKVFSHRKLGSKRNWSENYTPSTRIYCSTSSYLHDGTERGIVSAVDPSVRLYRGSCAGKIRSKNCIESRTGRRKTQILVSLWFTKPRVRENPKARGTSKNTRTRKEEIQILVSLWFTKPGGDSHLEISVIPMLGDSLYTCEYRAGIFILVWGPGIDSKEWIPPAYVVLQAGMITLFLFGS
jgi:hypothetical protein